MPIVHAKHLTKKFGKFIAVNNISFSLEEGEILGFLGPNGAGKTTTIQMLLGVLTPTAGSIFYFNKNLENHREEIMEKVNFSSTYTSLPWWLTVKENLTFIAYLYDMKKRKERIGEIIEILRMQDIFHKKMSELSAGQLTRVNLAKSLLNHPKVLLLDEPTASLDVEIAKYIREFLLEEQKRTQLSIIITSHNMGEVEELCDRVILIDKGKIVANDTPDNLARSIHTSHVELFIKDGLKRVVEYCNNKKIHYTLEGRYIIVDVATKNIPNFLEEIVHMDIVYNEISIEKPSLEDYFLETIEQKTL